MLVALNNNVILKVGEPEETKSGTKLVIPELARAESNIGTVVSCNPLQSVCEVGMRVVFRPHSAIKINYEGEEYLITPVEAIVARIK